jgi:NAD(P)-dependent dehydrogenase (short-subunit alcohol dehydrogenase family)
VTPAELAEVIAFLLSPAASGVSGACIPVTGRVF